jgi:hypothetical protein
MFMPAAPQVGDVLEQERAPGIAEDRSTVIATGVAVTVPAGTFNSCIETEDFDPIGMVTAQDLLPWGGTRARSLRGGRVARTRAVRETMTEVLPALSACSKPEKALRGSSIKASLP